MKISVVLTAFNAAPYLREAMGSIVAQAYADWEAICIDDGSTDETAEILDSFAARDPRIRVVHHQNIGLAASRNEGVSLATGDYLTFCDADDVLSPYWFSNAAKCIDESHPELLRANLCFAKEMPVGFLDKREAAVEFALSSPRECLRWAWHELFIRGFAVLNFIRTDLKSFIWFPEQLPVKEDSTMLIRLAPHLTSIVQSDYCGYFYRNTTGSLLRSKRTVRSCALYLGELFKIWQEQRTLAIQLELLDELNGVIQEFSDNDVIDWAINCADEPRETSQQVRQAWIALREAGAFDGRYHNRALFYLPFQWWKLTGQVMWLKLTWKIFLGVRKMVKG